MKLRLKEIVAHVSSCVVLFRRDSQGSILAEALVVIPVITLMAVSILEFGNVFWQRHLMEVGVRDAARYWSRCRNTIGGATTNCNETIAKNIAFYGQPVATNLRVPGWNLDSQITLVPATAADFPVPASSTDVVQVTGTLTYNASPLFGMLGLADIDLIVRHEERYVGW